MTSRLTCLALAVFATVAVRGTGAQNCIVPRQFQGDWFSMERGDDVNTLINEREFTNKFFDGTCYGLWNDNTTLDADGNHDSKIVFYSMESNCYRCYYMLYRTPNVVQYQQSSCVSTATGQAPNLNEVCNEILQNTEMWTFFRKSLVTVNCKNTFEGVFQFSYEWDTGGAGICNHDDSQIIACQEPGSPYVDNQVFKMNFAKCPDVSSSVAQQIKFQCMGMWEDNKGNVWSGVADLGEEVMRNRFRCMLTRYDQEDSDNRRRYSMSWWADCSSLKSPYEGPLRLGLTPVVGGFQLMYARPQCMFPTNYSGHWFHIGEFPVHADINSSHIYFKTIESQYTFKETYFSCLMNVGSRFLTLAVTVGKCELDFVCWDLTPRTHSVIRWRMSKPYRLTSVELSYPNFEMYMFRQACTWTSFTIDRKEFEFEYNTFLLDPPAPIPCPIRGRFEFVQRGDINELYKTRIKGITVNPRHMIDCRHYVTEWKSCDLNPTKIAVDAEYCETVDHTGRPVGEYDMPDWEHMCIGYWKEDWKFHLVTWDPEDAMSPFRCWVYERTDWRHVRMSRSTSARCWPTQTATSYLPSEGASLSLDMEESERQYDDCSMMFVGDDPSGNLVYEKEIVNFGSSGSPIHKSMISLLSVLWAFAIYIRLRVS